MATQQTLNKKDYTNFRKHIVEGERTKVLPKNKSGIYESFKRDGWALGRPNELEKTRTYFYGKTTTFPRAG